VVKKKKKKREAKKEGKFKVADLVMYSEKLPFPMPHLTIGMIIEVIDLRKCIQDIIDENDPKLYINDGFLKEWANYNKLRDSLQILTSDSDYLKQREYMLDRIMDQDQEYKYVYKVLWNDGVQYTEHPEDLVPFKLNEQEQEQQED
jgi:hypothetical protein